MVRGVLSVVLAVVVLTAAGGRAFARHPMCELPALDELMSLGPDPRDDDPPPPIEHRQCVPGFGDDANCWPNDGVPDPGGSVSVSTTEIVLLTSDRPPLVPAIRRAIFSPALLAKLAAGHVRRVERPPRAAA
jgi:hypothetical protein